MRRPGKGWRRCRRRSGRAGRAPGRPARIEKPRLILPSSSQRRRNSTALASGPPTRSREQFCTCANAQPARHTLVHRHRLQAAHVADDKIVQRPANLPPRLGLIGDVASARPGCRHGRRGCAAQQRQAKRNKFRPCRRPHTREREDWPTRRTTRRAWRGCRPPAPACGLRRPAVLRLDQAERKEDELVAAVDTSAVVKAPDQRRQRERP